jgi:hypothetical protein
MPPKIATLAPVASRETCELVLTGLWTITVAGGVAARPYKGRSINHHISNNFADLKHSCDGHAIPT